MSNKRVGREMDHKCDGGGGVHVISTAMWTDWFLLNILIYHIAALHVIAEYIFVLKVSIINYCSSV